jgi:hypothetical protein
MPDAGIASEIERERYAADCVEWLAAFWELQTGGKSQSANPQLLTLLRFTPGLVKHPASECVAHLSRSHPRDRLIKDLVGAVYGETPEHPELWEALRSFVAQPERLVGSGFYGLIRESRAEALEKARELAGELNPAADLERVTGERPQLRIVLAPSVFLPPPQAGRHGALVQRPEGWIAFLMFGLPLRRNLEQLQISRPWLLGGAWHYAIEIYLRRYWPVITEQLTHNRDLEEAVSRAMGTSETASNRPWTDVLKLHLNVALKCLLSRQLGVPDIVHRAFAKVTGLRLFPWFQEWLLDSGAEGAAFTKHLLTLPAAMAAQRSRWESIASYATSSPSAINLALLSNSARRASMVVPDDWPEDVATAAVAGWRLLRAPVFRYSEWLREHSDEAVPVVAFGEPGSNPLVDRVLEQRGLVFDSIEPQASSIVAISPPVSDEASWCIAVAARPESAARLRIETALAQTSTYFTADGIVVVDREQASLD